MLFGQATEREANDSRKQIEGRWRKRSLYSADAIYVNLNASACVSYWFLRRFYCGSVKRRWAKATENVDGWKWLTQLKRIITVNVFVIIVACIPWMLRAANLFTELRELEEKKGKHTHTRPLHISSHRKTRPMFEQRFYANACERVCCLSYTLTASHLEYINKDSLFAKTSYFRNRNMHWCILLVTLTFFFVSLLFCSRHHESKPFRNDIRLPIIIFEMHSLDSCDACVCVFVILFWFVTLPLYCKQWIW